MKVYLNLPNFTIWTFFWKKWRPLQFNIHILKFQQLLQENLWTDPFFHKYLRLNKISEVLVSFILSQNFTLSKFLSKYWQPFQNVTRLTYLAKFFGPKAMERATVFMIYFPSFCDPLHFHKIFLSGNILKNNVHSFKVFKLLL